MVLEIGLIRAALRPIARSSLRAPMIQRSAYHVPARIAPAPCVLPSRFGPQAGPSRPSILQSLRIRQRPISTSPYRSDGASGTVTATAFPADAATNSNRSETASDSNVKPVTIPKSMPAWLFTCSGLVFGIIIIGGLTRLTESGLSITEWEPITGILPPIGDEQWAVEWDKYKVSPEGIMMNSKISMSEFKKIFYMEWGHRLAGRALGLAFVVPMIYYMSRYRLPRPLPFKLIAIGLGIGFQGALGWYMVKSGLEESIIENNAVPRVSQYRLAAHLSAALLLYVGMLSTAIGLRRDLRGAVPAPIPKFKRLTHLALGMVFLTAVSGAFVAGLDAGLVYNEFPTMGGRLVPPTDELMDPRYAKQVDGSDRWWRNLLENPVTAQFDHRVLACTTFTLLLSLPFLARRASAPLATRRWATAVAGAAVAQVTLGITTLLYMVPTHVAATHQAGSVVLLSCLLGLAGTMRRPGRAARAIKSVIAAAPRT